MPIHSSFSTASDKLALPRANASSRASSDDPKSSFQSLLGAMKPASTEKNDRPAKSSRHQEASEPKASEKKIQPKNKADGAEKTEQAAKSPDETAPETETGQPQGLEDETAVPADAETVEAAPEEFVETEMTVKIALPQTPETGEVVDAAIEETPTDVKGEPADPAGATLEAQAMVAAVQQSTAPTTIQSEPVAADETENSGVNAVVATDPKSMEQTPLNPALREGERPENQTARPTETRVENGMGHQKSEMKTDMQPDAAVPGDEAAPSEDFGRVLDHLTTKASPEQAAMAGTMTNHSPKPAEEGVPAAQAMRPAEAMESNQDRIITGIQSQISSKGGTMRIRLDPPELGAMQVKVEMRGEKISATFQASNEQAAKMLTHGLEQLKTALEKQGLSVDRLQVQTTRNDGDQAMGGDSGNQSAGGWQGYQNQQDQQRRETLNRLWKRAAYGRDPLDMVA